MKNLNMMLAIALVSVTLTACSEKQFAASGATGQLSSADSGIYPPPPTGDNSRQSDTGRVTTPPRTTGGSVTPPPVSNPTVPPVSTPVVPPVTPTAPVAQKDSILDFLRKVHGDIFLGTQYDHSRFNPDASLSYWRNRYNPSAGIGCRAIIEAFLIAYPARAAAHGAYGVAASGPDAALSSYIQMQYRAILPGVDAGPFYSGPQYNIYRWYVDRHINMTQLDALFLDHPLFKNRCAAAGLSF